MTFQEVLFCTIDAGNNVKGKVLGIYEEVEDDNGSGLGLGSLPMYLEYNGVKVVSVENSTVTLDNGRSYPILEKFV